VRLVKAQFDALLAAAENAVAAPCYKDAKALACEVALDEVRFALQALARGLAAINVTPAFEALLAAEKAEKFADEDEP
jgi:S-adenosylmethionine:diacylglycerol 3-amino-3-carboxypropyl transferase